MLREKLRKILETAAGTPDLSFSLEAPSRAEFGDYSTNLPLVLAKKLGTKPMDVASELTAKISDSVAAESRLVNGRSDIIKKIEPAPPGFLNITLSDSVLQSKMERILSNPHTYGEDTKGGKKIQLEFISANPTGPLTLANGRGGFFGDVLGKVLKMRGYVVEREYYVNDAGNQVRMLGLSVLAAGGLVPDDEVYYHGEHITDWAKNRSGILNEKKDNPEELGRVVAEEFLENFIQPATQNMEVAFDRWTSEYKDIREKSYVDKFLDLAKSKNLVYEKDGATWLKTTDFGDDKDRVLITSDSFPTYFFVDAGHYLETKERGFDIKINILGADHHGYVSRIQAVAKIVGIEKSDVVVMQLVHLLANGEQQLMSKRKGVFVTIDDLIKEVGLDAVRYFFLEKNPETHINFDIELAKKQSKENPVYYIQYAHARLASIFRKIAEPISAFDVKNLSSDSERALLRKLIQFPDIIEDIAIDYRISRLVHYAHELAQIFHYFYEKNRIIDAEPGVKEARIALASATQFVLKKTLEILGVKVPDEM